VVSTDGTVVVVDGTEVVVTATSPPPHPMRTSPTRRENMAWRMGGRMI
jgi:hypothetical protein